MVGKRLLVGWQSEGAGGAFGGGLCVGPDDGSLDAVGTGDAVGENVRRQSTSLPDGDEVTVVGFAVLVGARLLDGCF